MSSKNDDSMAAIMVVAFIGAVGIMLFMLAAFVTFVLTILCLFAWDRPIGSGKFIITPEEARGFIGRGIAGAFFLTAFFVFMDIFFGVGVNWNYLLHIAGTGYIIGSLGIAILMAEEEASPPVVETPRQQVLPPSPPVEAIVLSPPRQRKRANAPDASFKYASWDDEEEAWR